MKRSTKILVCTLAVVGAVFLSALVILTLIPPTSKFLFVFQSVVMGRTNDERCNIISPGRTFTGKFYTYHKNLALDGELDFVDGKVTGKWIRHDQDTGIIWWSGEYRANVAVGDWRWYSPATGALENEEKGGGYYEGIGEEEFMVFGTTWSDVQRWVGRLFTASP